MYRTPIGRMTEAKQKQADAEREANEALLDDVIERTDAFSRLQDAKRMTAEQQAADAAYPQALAENAMRDQVERHPMVIATRLAFPKARIIEIRMRAAP